ncbi:MAG: WcbI family polysaccharide biosynthesis putative acetyltransferase [Actinomycetota bacterium]|nr:WcbI family polysaccharide biosynthesis putative acetyltransferase [Actinomycetota bacterium]
MDDTSTNDTAAQPVDQGRREHYGQFYGLHAAEQPDLPLLIVYGNCQAEATRILLDSAADQRWRTVRMPPVHELEAADLPYLRAVLADTTYLVAQPVVDGYRDLPLGTREIADLLPERAVIARFPSLRWAALFPTQVIVRVPGVGDPPVVPYHDLRVLLAAANGARPSFDPVHPDGVRAVRDDSAAQLRARQERHGTVDAATILERAGADTGWVINHPHNYVLREVAQAILAALGLRGVVVDPGRVLLGDLRAPVYPQTLQALGIEGTPRAQWSVRGEQVSEQDIAEEQLRWYAEHPEAVTLGLQRHAELVRVLRL